MKNYETKRVFPVIITPPIADKFYVVDVPDIDRMTQGESLAEALDMAEDLICVHCVFLRDANLPIPEPSVSEPAHKAGELVSWVTVDIDDYSQIHDTKSVRKNVTIPAWMAERASAKNINLSRVLQETLKSQFISR